MMKNLTHNIYCILLLCFMAFVIGGCIIANTPQTTSQSIETLVQTPQIETPIFTVSPDVVPTIPNPSDSSSTPLPTLSLSDAYLRFQRLLENNNDCRLPCWWGVIPGKTTWYDAERFLQTFSTINSVDNINGTLVAYVSLPLPTDKGTLTHSYYVNERSIVMGIDAYVYDWMPSLYLSAFLSEYGPPDNVFVRTFKNGIDGSWPFQIDLFYSDLGLLLEYSGGSPNIVGENIQNCFDDMYSPFIYMWSSDIPMKPDEVFENKLDIVNMPYPVPLEKAANMDVITFYETFKNPDNATCLETPLEFWPDY